MTELFKIIRGIYDPTCVSHFDFIELSEDFIMTIGVTDTNSLNITVITIICKYTYTNCVISIWKFIRLCTICSIVLSAETVHL